MDSPLEINSENFESIKEVLIFLFNPNNPKDYPETYGALHKKLQVSVFNFIQEYKRQHPKLALSGSVESPSDIS